MSGLELVCNLALDLALDSLCYEIEGHLAQLRLLCIIAGILFCRSQTCKLLEDGFLKNQKALILDFGRIQLISDVLFPLNKLFADVLFKMVYLILEAILSFIDFHLKALVGVV